MTPFTALLRPTSGRARIASILITAAVGLGTAGLSPIIANADPSQTQQPGSSVQESDPSLDARAQAIGDAFAALDAMPADLAELPPSDPAVQQWILENVPNVPSQPGVITPQFNPFTCSVAIAQFAVETGIPISKIRNIASEVGGFREFGAIVAYFVRNGSFPANATNEVIDLLLGLTGLGSVAAGCI